MILAMSGRVNVMAASQIGIRSSRQVRAQSLRDDQAGGGSSNIVDGRNMKVLKERMEKVKVRERLEGNWSKDHDHDHDHDQQLPAAGWNYKYNNNNYYIYGKKHDHQAEAEAEAEAAAVDHNNLSQYFQSLVGMTSGGAISALTILTATAFLCFVSLLPHFHL